MDPIHLWAYCPCGSHSVISRLLAGGSLGFRIVLVLLPGSQISIWHCCGLVVCLFALPLPYQSLGDTMLSSFSYIADAYELISWSPAVFFVCFVLFWFLFCVAFPCLVLWCVLFVCVFCCFRCLLSVLPGTAQWIMYRSNSVLFRMHIVYRTDLIRWICKMQLSFRLDKRPGESHLALDGKNTKDAATLRSR